MATTAEYLNKLVEQKNTLADNLVTKGVTATHDETLETLVPKVLEISGGSGGQLGIYPIGADGYPYGDVIIPEGVTSISSGSENSQRKSCFYANTNVNSVKLPSSMKTLGEYGFRYSSLTDVIFNEKSNVTQIGSMCFYSCKKLKSICIPATVSSIGMYAFYDCTELTSVIFEDGSQITQIPSNCFCYCTSLISIEIPYGVTALENGALYGCSKMTHISLPNTITSLGSDTFGSCTTLETVDLEQDFNCSIAFNQSKALANAAEMLTKLKDLTGVTSKTITFAKAVYDALTADEIAVATNKNWTVASYDS